MIQEERPLPLEISQNVVLANPEQRIVALKFWLLVGGVSLLWVLPILYLHYTNNRLLPSWHGFLHYAIANQFAFNNFPPENPFFAGEVLPYYWVYHFLGFTLSSMFHVDTLHAFQGISLASLVVLVFFAALLGREKFRSTGAGLMIGFLALVGVNPLGPVIALAKHYVKGTQLISDLSTTSQVENVFLSWEVADSLMTQPLLPAMYIMSNWKHGQNIVWFFDISSRTPALALCVTVLFVFLRSRLTLLSGSSLVGLSVAITSLNPLIGFSLAGSLFSGSLVSFLIWKAIRSPQNLWKTEQLSFVYRGVLCVVGCGLAYPAYSHLFALHESTLAFSSFPHFLLKSIMIASNFLILLPLALVGWLSNRAGEDHGMWSVTLGAVFLMCAVPLFSIKPGNEHNLTNVTQCLLAVSAIWGLIHVSSKRDLKKAVRTLFSTWTVQGAGDVPHSLSSYGKAPLHSPSDLKDKKKVFPQPSFLTFAVTAAIFLPTTLGSLFSFSERPSIPLGFEEGRVKRLPAQGPLNLLYNWITAETPRKAVFICDPRESVKMSGNVAELPAFTGRSLYVGSPTYMTQPYKEGKRRKQIAYAATHGHPLQYDDLLKVQSVRRPLFVVTYHAEEANFFAALQRQFGPPIFKQDFVAVFNFHPISPIGLSPHSKT